MSFPHGPEFPTRHDHTGKTLPRPPPPQLPPSHRKEKGGGNVVEAAELASPGAQWGPAAWPPGGLRLGRPAHRERLRNRAVLVKMRAGSSSGGGKGRRPERPRVLGHIPASLAPIHPPPPCVRPRGECGWRALRPDWRRVIYNFGSLISNAIYLPPPLLPDPWALVGVGDYLRLRGIRWGTGAGVPGRGHTQPLIPWGGGQP